MSCDECQICASPFSFVDIFPDFTIYPCCAAWTNAYSFGNIMEDKFEDVWHSEKARAFRRKIINGEYSLCKRTQCFPDMKPLVENARYSEKPPPPELIKFSHDYECNFRCRMCTSTVVRNSDEHLKKLDDLIDARFIPMLEGVSMTAMSGSGDPFGSRHYQTLIDAAASTYPKLVFGFHTNGMLCDRLTLTRMNLPGRIHYIMISVHAGSAKVYKEVTGVGRFDKLLGNLSQLSEMKQDGEITDDITLIFTVSSMNFRDMPRFVKLAELFDFKGMFWELYNFGGAAEIYSAWDDYNVCSPSHPEYAELQTVLKSVIHIPNLEFSPMLKQIAAAAES